MNEKLNAPILENKIVAQTNLKKLTIPFAMNKGVGEGQFDNIELILKSAQSNLELTTLTCSKANLYKKDNEYWAQFTNGGKDLPLQRGQYYKIQIAYSYGSGGDKVIGFYSDVATFKFTFAPQVTIKDLNVSDEDGDINLHKYSYTGQYYNTDPSEKVYSYQFYLYDSANNLVATSGECLHNAAKDQDRNNSIDLWNVKYGLEAGRDYLLNYEVTTINGLKCTSERYKIVDGQTVPSNIFKYSNFIAENNQESACVSLKLKPKEGAARKLMNGKFVLFRASDEDNFSSWQEVTRFILAAWDTSIEKTICNDYSVAQGIKYKYGLQAYNNQNIYSIREETPIVQVDFEDMFLSDGDRQLRIQFNPKISSFKNTILETKLDTIGGKYPFFFRNGNVKYKEFPISGLISTIMDQNHDFISGIHFTPSDRTETSAIDGNDIYEDAPIQLTSSNFRKERDFKLEVLEWLTNGKPKIFRSPAEGNFIVRLMNTSLTPTDGLSRMIHTFSSTAYEIADYTFDNLRKYGMMIDDYIETRDLQFFNTELEKQTYGSLSGLNACVATLSAKPSTQFFYKLRENDIAQTAYVGTTGVFVFPNEVLQENPLMEIWHENGKRGWGTDATLTYAKYVTPTLDTFSYVHSIKINDKIDQWIGQNREEVNYHFDKYSLITSIGLAYYLNISQRPKVEVTSVVKQRDDTYKFKIKDIEYTPGKSDLIFCTADNNYYCGMSRKKIGPESELDFDFQLRDDDKKINLKGTSLSSVYFADDNISFVSTGGRLVLTNVSNVNCLYLGNALFVDIAYQEINKTYTAEATFSSLRNAKNNWINNKTESNYTKFCNIFKNVLNVTEEDLIENAL